MATELPTLAELLEGRSADDDDYTERKTIRGELKNELFEARSLLLAALLPPEKHGYRGSHELVLVGWYRVTKVDRWGRKQKGVVDCFDDSCITNDVTYELRGATNASATGGERSYGMSMRRRLDTRWNEKSPAMWKLVEDVTGYRAQDLATTKDIADAMQACERGPKHRALLAGLLKLSEIQGKLDARGWAATSKAKEAQREENWRGLKAFADVMETVAAFIQQDEILHGVREAEGSRVVLAY